MSGTEIAGIGIFIFFILIGVIAGGNMVAILILGAVGLLFGLPVYLWGVHERKKEVQTSAVLTENPTIIVKEVSLGHYEEYSEYIGGSIGYRTVDKWFSSPNSANGWTSRVRWISGYNKVIKYITFHISTYNDVGDLEPCSIHNVSHFNVKTTGPIYKGSDQDVSCENLLYSKVHIRPELTSISVDFMDGSHEEIAKKDIKWASSLRW